MEQHREQTDMLQASGSWKLKMKIQETSEDCFLPKMVLCGTSVGRRWRSRRTTLSLSDHFTIHS
ncbi:mCG147866 [Mus musculus]|nr:mCG147866 [Mus musculus]